MYPNYAWGLPDRPVNYCYAENAGLVEQMFRFYTFLTRIFYVDSKKLWNIMKIFFIDCCQIPR